ncbi:PorP/SprF family type IX secretion system membrane protein [Membranihabitans marinus]|uniref:PorP/SprF family type IX secretion system membrane protein n=1 Tax=Membranihabitans marinus TaxID=1227546 RepID=UPI001F4587CF|nr:PorP/SprF family type IX secretion system membrane protein [Membranihabitans marinus]
MQLKFILVFITLFLFIITPSKGQDIHFTRYDLQPVMLNPAHTGAYNGSIRVTAIYRDQWANILPNQFSTPAITLDAPLAIGLKKEDWIGVGVNFYQDRAGIGKLSTTGFSGSLSYHLALDKQRKNVLTIGLSGGSVSKKIGDISSYIFEDQGQGEQSLSTDASGGTDFGAGLMFTSKVNKTDMVRFGLGVRHILPIDYQLTSNGNEEESMQINIHGDGSFMVNPQMDIEPAIVVQVKESLFLGYGQARLAYKVTPESDFRLVGGLGYRVGDAVQVLAGVDYKSWRFGIAYDYGTSQLSPAQSFEIGLTYIGKIFKRPKVKEVIFCPPF